MRSARTRYTTTLLADGWVLLAGGVDDAGVLLSAEIYDPGTGAFTDVRPMGTARQLATAVLLSGGRVLIAGGFAHAFTALSSAEISQA